MLVACLVFAGVRAASVYLHELSHSAVALLYRLQPQIHLRLGGSSCTTVPGAAAAGSGAVAVIRHSGWVFSLLLAIAATYACTSVAMVAALWLTALDAISSDALGWTPRSHRVRVCCNAIPLTWEL